ncbi:acylphosphatase [Nocardioides sp. Root1257]|uniref:acylphosphatase n=1 Tax=unclassified Nocardioides TaxID=2615069 RepID=UPI0006F245BE|nr:MULTISPECIES: acylphosphatase [unclassified Nocardioides]KQW48005.1 acylphosphatase [Nocardioides sp. Root1257]KRC45257.1 acylphosphatase [Nocardioides sp. Root224]
MTRAVRAVVTGRVQGVSFRAYAEQEARRVGVTGWVRNEPDGSVAAHVEGDDEAVDALVAWLRHGPRLAVVEHVDVRDAEAVGASSFEVRY